MRARLALLLLLAASLPAARAVAVDDPEPGFEAPKRLVVAIDPGHGGEDFGAVSNHVAEKNFVLAVARLLREELAGLPGLSVVMTRDRDEFVPLSERVERARQAGASAFISVHADKVRKRGREGMILYCYGPNRKIPKGPPRQPGELILPPPPPDVVAASRRLAGFIERALRAENIKVGPRDHGAFAVLKSPDFPSVLIEVGNLRDRREARGVVKAHFQRELVRAIALGFKRFLAEGKGRSGPLARAPGKNPPSGAQSTIMPRSP